MVMIFDKTLCLTVRGVTEATAVKPDFLSSKSIFFAVSPTAPIGRIISTIKANDITSFAYSASCSVVSGPGIVIW